MDFGINDLMVINKSIRCYWRSGYGVTDGGECFLDEVTTEIWDLGRAVGGQRSHFIMSVN